MKALQQHLEKITTDSLIDFRETAFMPFASCFPFSIGVNGNGMFIVKEGFNQYNYNAAIDAIDKYKELLIEHKSKQSTCTQSNLKAPM